MASTRFFLLALLAASISHAFASDPSQLQDFCVADKILYMSLGVKQVLVNGFACKDPAAVTVEDFFSGLHMAGNTGNRQGSAVTGVSVAQISGLNTLGISLARINYAPYGLNPPHINPCATKILTILEAS
uniref:Cupin type-1 domain-containing protein n=1 Tax=Oryza punctata TaxID=4537 RepID=A0A0E0JZY3_ORYPU